MQQMLVSLESNWRGTRAASGASSSRGAAEEVPRRRLRGLAARMEAPAFRKARERQGSGTLQPIQLSVYQAEVRARIARVQALSDRGVDALAAADARSRAAG